MSLAKKAPEGSSCSNCPYVRQGWQQSDPYSAVALVDPVMGKYHCYYRLEESWSLVVLNLLFQCTNHFLYYISHINRCNSCHQSALFVEVCASRSMVVLVCRVYGSCVSDVVLDDSLIWFLVRIFHFGMIIIFTEGQKKTYLNGSLTHFSVRFISSFLLYS